MKKRTESVFSAVDIGFNSLISFLTFLYIKEIYGIDILGFWFSFIRHIICGNYSDGVVRKPAYLGFSVGYKNFRLNLSHLIIVIFFHYL